MKRENVFEFYRRLAEANPSPQPELEYVNPYTLLVAVALSEQSTDVGVNKAKNVIAAAQMLVDRHNGEVPQDREKLETLPGVGRKTANVVLNAAFGEPRIAVDTHIF